MFLVEASGARRGFKVDHPEQAGSVLPLDFDYGPGVNQDDKGPGLFNTFRKHLQDFLGVPVGVGRACLSRRFSNRPLSFRMYVENRLTGSRRRASSSHQFIDSELLEVT